MVINFISHHSFSRNQHVSDFRHLIGNRQAALIGGQAFCAACGQTGIIIKAGGPYRPRYPGGEGALEFDVLQCGCQSLPKLLVVTHNQAKVEDQNQGITD
ncbi:hypothetical protein ACQEPQ_003636 [Escherichia albertii]